jgi:hypothetical protein
MRGLEGDLTAPWETELTRRVKVCYYVHRVIGRIGDYRIGDYRIGDYRIGDYRIGDYRIGDYRIR